MSKWKTVKLGEVCKFINGDRGKNYPSGKDIVENGIPFINAGHLVNNEISFSSMNYITEDKYNQLGSGKIQKGDFLYCLRGSLGKHAIVENLEKGAVASSLVILRPTNIDVHYLSYCMDSPSISTQLQQANNGSSQPNLSANSVKQYIVPLPPLEEQKRIADILDKASNLIDLRKQQLEKMDLLIKSKFIDMFGNPVTNPKGWEKCEWKKVFNTATGKLDSNAMNENGKYPFFTCSKEVHFIDTYAFDQEALLLAGNNATANYDVKYYSGKFNAYQRTYILTLKECNNQYCFFKILLEQKLQHLQQQSKGSNTKYLTMGILDKLDFILPPTSLQNQFAAFVEQVEKQKAVMQQSLEKMETNYKALMQEYFG